MYSPKPQTNCWEICWFCQVKLICNCGFNFCVDSHCPVLNFFCVNVQVFFALAYTLYMYMFFALYSLYGKIPTKNISITMLWVTLKLPCYIVLGTVVSFSPHQLKEIWKEGDFKKVAYLINRFFVALCLFSNRSHYDIKMWHTRQKPSFSLMFLLQFLLCCDILLNRRMTT